MPMRALDKSTFVHPTSNSVIRQDPMEIMKLAREKRVPCQAKKPLGRQEWLSMDTAGHMPRPRSMLPLLATPVPCALLFTRAASACAAHRPASA